MSIKEIAKKAGTSPATVSRVLNNPDYKCANPGLRKKIIDAAIELHYVPNEAARKLKKGEGQDIRRIYRISVLVTRIDKSDDDPFFRELLRAVESEIHNSNCIINRVWYNSIFSSESDKVRKRLASVVEKLVSDVGDENDGIVIIGKCSLEAIRLLKKNFKHIVSVNRNSTNYEVDEVLCDGEKIASKAVKYLISIGHKKIGYVGSCKGEARYHGYCASLGEVGIDIYPEYVIDVSQSENEGYKALEAFSGLEDPPTGIYCANDIMAIGALKYISAKRFGEYAPSIISSDDIEAGQFTDPMLTTVNLPKETMAKFAVYLLIDHIKGGHSREVRLELEGKLVVRNSCTEI